MRCHTECHLLLFLLCLTVTSVAAQQTHEDTTQDTGPSWSPDGTRIGFSSTRNGGFDLYEIGVDGHGLKRLTTAEGDDHYVAWSPDGAQIAFISDRDGENKLYVMNADGTGAKAIATTKVAAAPSWSPDGAHIAFQKLVKGELPKPGPDFRPPQPGELDTDILVINPNGTGARSLARHPALDGAPVWSPDGQWIAFSSNRHNVAAMRERDIYIMRADGSEVQRLTTGLGATVQAWSPDGTKLTFGSRKDGNPELYVVSRDGAHVQRLTDFPGPDFYAQWSPDGQQIVFTSGRDGNQEIYVMQADGSDVRRITHN